MPRIKQLYASMHEHPHSDHKPKPSIHSMNCRIRTIYSSTPSTPQTIRNTHNIIETTHLLCFIQMILDSTLLVSKIISINIVSMILARTILIYHPRQYNPEFVNSIYFSTSSRHKSKPRGKVRKSILKNGRKLER